MHGLFHRLFDFEAVPDAPVEAAPPAAAEPPAAAPVAAPPAWTPSREEWEQTQAFQAAIIEALQEPEGDPPVADAPLIDLTNPQAVLDEMDRRAEVKARELLEAEVGAYRPIWDADAAEKGKAMVLKELDVIANGDQARGVQGIGEFDRDLAAKLTQAYWTPDADPNQVLLAAARDAQAFRESERAAALGVERGQLQNRLDAGTTPAAGAAADLADGYPAGAPPGLDKYQLTAWSWEQRQRASGSPVG